MALDPATHTIYVANGNNDNGPNADGNTVSVIDSRRCQAADVSRCAGPVARQMMFPNGPAFAVRGGFLLSRAVTRLRLPW